MQTYERRPYCIPWLQDIPDCTIKYYKRINEYQSRNLAVEGAKSGRLHRFNITRKARAKPEHTSIFSAASYVSDVEPFSELGEDADEPQKLWLLYREENMFGIRLVPVNIEILPNQQWSPIYLPGLSPDCL